MTGIDGDWMRAAATRKVMKTLTNAGFLAYFVGGCVRNALLDAPVSDVDIATDARPDRVMELARQGGMGAVATGYDHGTVTVVADGVGHEVTTFRKDIETDGRRAKVLFSDNITDDARRRDFTLNALYADLGGRVLDPLGGMRDLRAGRIRFIDDANARIREDYLRTLRFFRFHAWYGRASGGLDAEALAAISANLTGLETLSRERIGAEVKKLLAAPNPSPAVAAMQQAGVLACILPGADARALPVLVHLEGDETPDPIRRLAALGGVEVAQRLRLSRRETDNLARLRDAVTQGGDIGTIAYRNSAKLAVDAALLQAALSGQPLQSGYRHDARFGAAQVFPVKAADLMPGLQGRALGQRLRELEERWVKSGFELTRSQLLE